MKKKLTSMLSAALACVMCLGLLTVPASAALGTEAESQLELDTEEEAAEQGYSVSITGDDLDFGTHPLTAEGIYLSQLPARTLTVTNTGTKTIYFQDPHHSLEYFKLTPDRDCGLRTLGLVHSDNFLDPGESVTYTVQPQGYIDNYDWIRKPTSYEGEVDFLFSYEIPGQGMDFTWKFFKLRYAFPISFRVTEMPEEDMRALFTISADELDFGVVEWYKTSDSKSLPSKTFTITSHFPGSTKIDLRISSPFTIDSTYEQVAEGEIQEFTVKLPNTTMGSYEGVIDLKFRTDRLMHVQEFTAQIPVRGTVAQDGTVSFSIYPSSNARYGDGTTTSWGTAYEEKIAYGTDKTYSVQPGPGYRVAAAYVDGVNVGPMASYTFSDVREHHTIRFMLAKEDWHYFYLPASDSLYADHQYTGTSSTTDENGDKQTVYIYPEGTRFYSVLGDSGYGKVNYDTPENPDDDGSLDLAQPFAAEKAGQVYRLRSYTVGYSGSDFGTYVYVMCQGQPDPNEFDIFDPAKQPSYWAVEQVNAAIAANIVPKALQSKYTQSITRAEFCALAVQLYETLKGAAITERAEFTDTSDVNVQKMAGLGVVNGVGDNKFAPNDKLTREEAATMLSRLAKAVGKPLTTQAAAFADKASISSWALEAVGQMQKSGIMNGVGDNKFDPWGAYTREQSILTMLRMLNAMK